MRNQISTAVHARRVSLLVLLGFLSELQPAAALDAQWLANPASGNFGDAANWSGGVMPTGTATFGASSQTAIRITTGGGLMTLNGGIALAPDASSYTFGLSSGGLAFTGAGVTVNGGSATFNLSGTGVMAFAAASAAGSASYVLDGPDAAMGFVNSSSSGSAAITNYGGRLFWMDSATAGSAIITNNSGLMMWQDSATAGNATITNNDRGAIAWQNTSTAGDATVVNNGGIVVFSGNATAGNARLVSNAGFFDFTATIGPLGDGKFSAGSIEGAGNFALGGGELTVGSNNLSTTVSGVIGDCPRGDGCANQSTGGSLVKIGEGTLTLTGANTYSGGTTINGGTLAVSSDASLGAAAGMLTLGGGTLRFLNGFTTDRWIALNSGNGTFDTNGHDATLQGAIGGDGGLIKIGEGTLTLTNENSYRGGTTINAGTVAIRNNINLGGGGVVFNGGTLQFLQDASSGRPMTFNAAGGAIDTMGNVVTLGGPLSGDGGLTKVGSGVLVLEGSSTILGPTTVAAGTLAAGDVEVFSRVSTFVIGAGALLDVGGFDQAVGGLAGAGSVTNSGETPATLTVGANGANTMFSGIISDGLAPLALVKTGGGTLVLDGQNTYTGPTTIQAGKLVVGDDSHPAASLTSVVTLTGGTLGGIGTVGGIAVGDGARVAPGNSIGTLNVTGNVSFAAGSFYDVELNPAGQSDRLAATGAAQLSGGTVTVSAPTGVYRTGTRYTILTANGGVTGTFASLAQTFPFLQLALTYDSTNVYLDVTRGTALFPSVAITPNQVAAAAAVETLGAGTALYDAVVQQPSAAGARQAFDALSGEVQASARTVMIEDSRFVREAAIDRLRVAFDGVGAVPAPMMAYASGGPGSAPAGDGIALWARGFGAWGAASGNGNAAGLSRDIGGLFAGGDARVADTWRLGLLGGYSHSSFRVGDRSSSGASDNYHVGVYGGTQWGSVAFRSGAAFTWHDLSSSRSVIFPGFADALKGDQQARTTQVFGELGYRMQAGRLALEPFANAAYVNLSTDGFTERGGAAALAVRGDSAGVTFTTLGVRAAREFAFAGGPGLTARGSFGWRHAFGETTPFATAAFAGGASFGIAGLPIGRDAAVAGAGLDIALTRSAILSVSYDGQFDARLADQSVKANLSVKF